MPDLIVDAATDILDTRHVTVGHEAMQFFVAQPRAADPANFCGRQNLLTFLNVIKYSR